MLLNKISKLLAILGSTSTGKTDVALRLAKKFNGELISCDSRQVYVGLDIGTGKLPDGRWKIEDRRWRKGKGFWEIAGIKIWMYDVVDPKNQYSVFGYIIDAGNIVRDIWKRGKLPIIVGGTGFYLKALLEGLPNLAIPIDKNLREDLQKLSKEKLQKELQQIAPDRWKSLNKSDKQNPRRLIRAIEISMQVNADGEVDKNATAVGLMSIADTLIIGLTAPREILYQRIGKRVVSRIDQGMIDEARNLHRSGLSFRRMRQLGLEYGVLADYLQGKITRKEELIKVLQGKIHGYARRQITWFKKEKDVFWFDITDENLTLKVEELISKWYDTPRNYAA